MCCCCSPCCSDIILIIVSVLFPPLPVWIRRGICSCDSLINILLCLLGYLPGLIHSWYIIAKYPPYTIDHDTRVYYVYGQDLERGGHHHHHHHEHHHTHNNTIVLEPSPLVAPVANYGAIEDTPSSRVTSPITSPVPSSSQNQIDDTPAGVPPPYTEFDNKTQH